MKNETIPASSRLTKNKFVVVGVIVGVLILALVLFSGRQFVGKAIEAQSQAVNPVLEVISGSVAAGSSSTIRLKVDVGTTPMTAATFSVTAPGLCSATITDRFLGLLGQQDPQQAYTCASDVLNFDDGLIGGPKSGTINLLDIQLTPAAVPVQFTFSKFDLFSDEHKFLPATQLSFSCEGTTCTAGAADTDLDDDSVLNVNDGCPNTGPGATVDANGCSAVQVDGDSDGKCNPGKTSTSCTGGDNCPVASNADQANQDSDTNGDVCDTTPCGANAVLSGTCQCSANFVNTDSLWNNGCEGTAGGSCPTADQQCPGWFETNKDTKCSAWLSTLSTTDLNSKLTSAQKTALCAGATSTDFNADLNKDGKISNDDVVIMQLALEAMDPNLEPTKPACGKTGEVYCNFNKLIWVCENLKSTTTNPGDLKC